MKRNIALASLIAIITVLGSAHARSASAAPPGVSACGIPNIPVAATKWPPGTFNAASTTLSRCVTSTATQLNRNSQGAGVYNVKRAPYSARCDGVTDDTHAIQHAEQTAFAAGGGTVYIPAGRCKISTGIAWDSNVNLVGAGMFRTTLVASPDFSFDPRNVRVGPDGRYIGMLWLDGPSQTSPLQNVTVSDVGFDPRAGIQGMRHGEFNYEPVVSYMRALQHVAFKDLYFNLGYNTQSYIGISDGPKGFTGFTLKLATDCNNSSDDVSFSDIVGHNGYGTIQIYGSDPPRLRCPQVTELHNVRINGVADFVDGQYIDDDRVVVDGSGVQRSEISNVTIKNIQTIAFDDITGGINSIKINPGAKGTIHGVTIENVRYRGPAVGRYTPPLNLHHAVGSGSPVAILGNASPDGAVNDVTIDNVHATNSMGMPVALKATPLSGQTVKLSVNNVSIIHCYELGAAMLIGFWSAPTGADKVHISNVTVQASPEALSQTQQLFGIMMRGKAPEHGVSGDVTVSDVTIRGYPIPLYVAGGPSFRNMTLARVRADRAIRLPRDATINLTP